MSLALQLYDDAIRGEVDQVVLVTNGTDVTPAFEMLAARYPHIVRGLVIPTRKIGEGGDVGTEANVSLAKHAHWVRRHISKDELRASQLPDVVPGRRRASIKPHSWSARPHHLTTMLEMSKPVMRSDEATMKWARQEKATSAAVVRSTLLKQTRVRQLSSPILRDTFAKG